MLYSPRALDEWGRCSPILSIRTPGNDNALRFCDHMRKLRLELKPIRYPTVPKGLERVRVSINLLVNEGETERMASEAALLWKEMHLSERI